jgi:hypothetical protein
MWDNEFETMSMKEYIAYALVGAELVTLEFAVLGTRRSG